MARKKSIIPNVQLSFWLPLDVKARLDSSLYSDAEQRIPFASYKNFFASRVLEFLEWRTLPLEPYGFPAGHYVRGPAEMIKALKLRLENENAIAVA